MRKLISIILFISATCAQAQFKIGAGGGLNFSNFAGSDVSHNQGITGYNLGFMFELKAPVKFGVEADLLYSVKGASFDYNFIALDPNDPYIPKDGERELSYLDIPLVLKLYTLKVVSFQLGVQYSFLLGADGPSYAGKSAKEQFKSADVAAVLGFGVDVSKLHFTCRYNYGLTSISDSNADVKNNMLTLTAGFWLKK